MVNGDKRALTLGLILLLLGNELFFTYNDSVVIVIIVSYIYNSHVDGSVRVWYCRSGRCGQCLLVVIIYYSLIIVQW